MVRVNRRVSAIRRVSPGPALGFMINDLLNVFTVVRARHGTRYYTPMSEILAILNVWTSCSIICAWFENNANDNRGCQCIDSIRYENRFRFYIFLINIHISDLSTNALFNYAICRYNFFILHPYVYNLPPSKQAIAHIQSPVFRNGINLQKPHNQIA